MIIKYWNNYIFKVPPPSKWHKEIKQFPPYSYSNEKDSSLIYASSKSEKYYGFYTD